MYCHVCDGQFRIISRKGMNVKVRVNAGSEMAEHQRNFHLEVDERTNLLVWILMAGLENAIQF